MSSVAKIRDSIMEVDHKLRDITAEIEHIHCGIYFRGYLSKPEFNFKLAAGEIEDGDCYMVDGATYIGSICVDSRDEPCYTTIEPDTAYPTRQLKSYTCQHCGGTIDTYTMHCMYCGVKYFFS